MPHHVDVHVGKRIRQCRWTLGMTREQLAAKSGLSAGEIGRCESGEAPPGLGGLFDMAMAMEVPLTFFFEGLPEPASGEAEKRASVLLEREAMELVRAYYALPVGQRKGLLDLAHTLRNAAK